MGARTITATVNDLVSFVQAEIAPMLEFNVPPNGGAVEGAAIERDHPTVYPFYIPSEERLADGQHQSPSIAVQVSDGTDGLRESRAFNVRLVLMIWAPGEWADDGAFTRTMDGWRELFNGLDTIVKAIETADTVAECTVDLESGIRYGFLDVDGEIPDLYPFWFGKVDFRLLCGAPSNKRFVDML
ncbi:MAG: hypothetical protein IJ087_01675 [Eggerthellaceae bacterium]|nr:hypothetical protein [Eggerthellaceae bacterium]